MLCKQCKYMDRCAAEADYLGQVFDPNYDGKHGCLEFEAFINADLIRAMSDEELARFLSDRFAKESCHRLYGEGRMLTATEIAAIGHTWYCSWMQWLKQPAEDE